MLFLALCVCQRIMSPRCQCNTSEKHDNSACDRPPESPTTVVCDALGTIHKYSCIYAGGAPPTNPNTTPEPTSWWKAHVCLLLFFHKSLRSLGMGICIICYLDLSFVNSLFESYATTFSLSLKIASYHIYDVCHQTIPTNIIIGRTFCKIYGVGIF